MSKTDKVVKKMNEKYVEALNEKYERGLDLIAEVVTKTAEDIYRDARDIYDQCIEQYYMYKTKSYYRHYVGKGTGTGENLYYSNQIKLSYTTCYGRKIPDKFSVEMNAKHMDGYKPWKDSEGVWHSVNKESVLEYVMSGKRGVDADGKFGNTSTEWYAYVSSKCFGKLEGTPNEIFDTFDKKFNTVVTKRGLKYFQKLKGKYNLNK